MLKNTIGYRLFIWGLLIFSFLLLWKLNSNILTQSKYIPVDDYVRHWAAGKSFLKRDDPYSTAKLQVFQDLATGPEMQSNIISTIFIPPWSMLIIAPFAFFDYPTSRLVWLLFSIVLLLVSAELLWKSYAGPPEKKWLSWILVFTFAPTIYLLEDGQTTFLVLLGLAGFLYFEKLHKDWIAGVFVALITVKPQLLFLFWPAIVFWSIKRRNFTILISFGLTLLLASILTVIINPQIFQQYFTHIKFNSPILWGTPTLGGYLRYFIFGVERFWPQYIGPLIGLVWFIFYWLRHKQQWLWTEQSPILVFASILTSLYGWTYDQVVLIVGVMKAGVRLVHFQKKTSSIMLAIYFLINVLSLFLHRYWDDFWFLWFAPSILIWYLAVSHLTNQNVEKP
jgi:hypothetical protein